MSETLALRPISRSDFASVAHIAVHPDQERFSGTVQHAFQEDSEGVDFHAICLDGQPVGFFKIDHAYAEHHWFARPGEPGLRAFLIDKTHQGRGIATAAIRALDGYLQAQYPDIASVVLTVNMANPVAVRAYRRGGFVDTGDIYEGGSAGPQLVMRMILRG